MREHGKRRGREKLHRNLGESSDDYLCFFVFVFEKKAMKRKGNERKKKGKKGMKNTRKRMCEWVGHSFFRSFDLEGFAVEGFAENRFKTLEII